MSHYTTTNKGATWHPVSKRRPVLFVKAGLVHLFRYDSPEGDLHTTNRRNAGSGMAPCSSRDGPTWSPGVRKIEVSAQIGEQRPVRCWPIDFGKRSSPALRLRLWVYRSMVCSCWAGWSVKIGRRLSMKDAHNRWWESASGRRRNIRPRQGRMFIPRDW
jgi:hypothetical protein